MPVHATELIVCTTCRPASPSRAEQPAGATLMKALQDTMQGAAPGVPVVLRGVACMSSCSRACTAALQSPGKSSYLFGDLLPDADTAAQLLACARLHADRADGNLPRQDRPERLRSGILVKLPPSLGLNDPGR